MAKKLRTGVVLGIDEVGVGCLAGPLVTVGAVFDCPPIVGVTDSKKLSPRRREELTKEILAHCLDLTAVSVSAQEIDEIGIVSARLDSYRLVHQHLQEASQRQIDVVILDGDLCPQGMNALVEPKADLNYWQVGAASIVAKVFRDRAMTIWDWEYPFYDWVSNKGYGAPKHLVAIKEHGLTPLHRVTFCKGVLGGGR